MTLDIDRGLQVSAQRIENTLATSYRLARRNGELVLQGCFLWTCGREYGHEWRDIPIVDLNELEAQ